MIEEQQRQEIVNALRIFISMVKDIAQGGESKRKGIMKFFHNKAVVKGNSFGISEVEIREIINKQTNKLEELIKGEGGIQSSINQLPDKVVEVIKTSFEKELSNIGATYTKTEDIQKALNKFIDEKIPDFMTGIEKKIGDSFDDIIKEVKAGNTEINRRLDLYMTSTEKTIAENTAQLKNVEKMLLLKEEQDRKNFDAIKNGLAEVNKNIDTLLTKDDAFAKFQELQGGNNDIKQQNDDIKQQIDDIKQQNNYIKTLLTNLAGKVYESNDAGKVYESNGLQDVLAAINRLDDSVTDSIKNAIAESDAKLLGMIMPEIANLKDKNDQILINQDTQTTILNSILSGQQNDALQFVAMSEKLDNLTELVSALSTKTKLVSALSTKTNEQSFAENANKLLENFATSQEAMFAAAFEKVAKKDDLKHLDTGIDSIIEKLHDDSVKFDEVCAVVENMANQIDSIARTGENNSKKLDDIHKILLSSRVALNNVTDCDRCHSADSMFYKCQICGNEGKRTNIAPNTRELSFDQTEGLGLLTLTPESNGSIIIDTCVRSIAASTSSPDNIQQKVEKYRNSARKIVFDACFRGENKCKRKLCDACATCSRNCQNCMRETTSIVLYDNSGGEENAENMLEYFPNLEVVSFAKPLDGKPKYILTSGLFYDKTKEGDKDGEGKKHTALQYYGGQYIREMEKGVFNIPDDNKETGRNFLLKLDPSEEGLLKRIQEISKKPGYGKGFWRKK